MSYSEAAFIVAILIFTLVSIILMTAQFYIMHALGISLFAAVTTFLYFDKEFEKLKKDWLLSANSKQSSTNKMNSSSIIQWEDKSCKNNM